jgi:hypothetical protein
VQQLLELLVSECENVRLSATRVIAELIDRIENMEMRIAALPGSLSRICSLVVSSSKDCVCVHALNAAAGLSEEEETARTMLQNKDLIPCLVRIIMTGKRHLIGGAMRCWCNLVDVGDDVRSSVSVPDIVPLLVKIIQGIDPAGIEVRKQSA